MVAWWFKLRNLLGGVVVVVAMLLGTGLGAVAQPGSHALKVHHGVLTVDGLPVQTGLEIRIANLQYLYICLPGQGTAIVSERPFAGAQEQRAAFHGSALTVMAGGRRLQLTASGRLRSTRSAYVRFDRGEDAGRLTPAIAFGGAATVPAVWPEQGIESASQRRRVRVSARRAPRSARLCRPSSHGGEQCAIVREVVYKP